MKNLLSLLIVSFLFGSCAGVPELTKIWETPANIPVPESVLPVPQKGYFYISLIDGKSWDADGKGGIGILSEDGKSFNSNWITGLNAPKGMGILNGKLYVADITNLAVIDIAKGAIEKKIPVTSAENLNDVTIGNGKVYVSDSKAGRIWELFNDVPSLYLDGVPATNGLKFMNGHLYFGEGKNFKKADANKNVSKIAELPQNIDGIEPLGKNDFIMTSWPGYIFYVDKKGRFKTLLETHEQGLNTADIGLDREKKILYVPTFNGKTIAAYKIAKRK